MNTYAADPNPIHRETWKTRVALPVALVALTLTLAIAALNQVIPNMAARPQGFVTRVSSYFHHGQVRADLRTLAAAVRFLLEPQSDFGAGAPANGAVAPGTP